MTARSVSSTCPYRTDRCVGFDLTRWVVRVVLRRITLRSQVNAATLEDNNMEDNLGRMKLFNARRKFKAAIQTVIVADRLRKFAEGMVDMTP